MNENSKTPHSRHLLLWSVPLLLLLLQGCGFHLRGSDGTMGASLPASVSPVYIQGLENGGDLRRILEERLYAAGAQLTNDPTAAASQLRISNRSSERRVVAVDGQGKVIEYQLSERLRFSLKGAQDVQWVEPQPVSAVQSYLNPETEVLGKQSEEASLRQDMYRRIADQIVRRLEAQLR
jgi:LPS-assembly lipoprotein